jgi:thiamine kinase-like enzyme
MERPHMTAIRTWAERNLLVLLDPRNVISAERWHFVKGSDVRGNFSNGLHIFTFPRKRLWNYLWSSLVLNCCGRRKEKIAVLKFQKGMTSALFHAGNASAHRAFIRSHASGKKTWRERIKSMLPCFITADLRYLAVGRELRPLNEDKALNRLKFMFYSNEAGKLMLAAPDTFLTGRGHLVVTTANEEYHPVLGREFNTMEQIRAVKPGLVPNQVNKISANGRLLFVEEYIAGTTLRETLRDKRVARNRETIVDFIDRLDGWFAEYRDLFRGKKVPLLQLYRSSLEAFADFHAGNERLERFLRSLSWELAEMDGYHAGLVPIMAHNDLWPGNFIVGKHSLVAIDWERVTFNRSELFDYFWMMVSAFLEYHIGKTGEEDYSQSFRTFVAGGDFIGELVREKLCFKLEKNGFHRKHYDLFLALFLLEWSMQGLQALGRQTRMDKLALGELNHYLEHAGDRFDRIEPMLRSRDSASSASGWKFQQCNGPSI